MFQSYSGNVFIFRTFDKSGIPNKYDRAVSGDEHEVLNGWFIGSDYGDGSGIGSTAVRFTRIEDWDGRPAHSCIYKSDLEKCSIKDMNDLKEVFRQLGYWVCGK